MRTVVPLSKRPIDLAFIPFFVFNILVVTYVVDLEQLVISDPNNFEYPIFPPKLGIDITHWYQKSFDPLPWFRPVWWKVTIWWDVLFFGPFYFFALYSWIKGDERIRLISIVWSSCLITIVSIILAEEVWGPHPAKDLPLVLALNLPWVLFPFINLVRMLLNEHPFTIEDEKKKK